MRPRIDTTFDPVAITADTRLPARPGQSPIEKKGPTVWEAVGAGRDEGLATSCKSSLHGRGFPPAQHNIETISQGKSRTRMFPIKGRNQPPLGVFVGHTVVNGVEFEQRITREIHLRHQPAQQASSKQREMNVRWAPRIMMIAPRVGSRLDGRKFVPPLAIGDHPSAAVEIRIKRGVVLIELVAVSSGGICLPYFHQRAAHRTAIFVEHGSRHNDTFTGGRAFVLRGQIAVVQMDGSMAKNWTRSFRKGARKQDQRLCRGTLQRRAIRRMEILGLRSWRHFREERQCVHGIPVTLGSLAAGPLVYCERLKMSCNRRPGDWRMETWSRIDKPSRFFYGRQVNVYFRHFRGFLRSSCSYRASAKRSFRRTSSWSARDLSSTRSVMPALLLVRMGWSSSSPAAFPTTA